MRKIKALNIDGRGEVIVKEVTPWALYTAWKAEGRLKELRALLDEACEPGFDELKNWYPSEQQEVLTGLLEVNSAFLAMARTLKVDGLLRGIVNQIAETLPAVFADLFRQGMGALGTTDGASS